MMKNTGQTARTAAWFYLIFFLSGFSCLVYQVVWLRQLSLIFGQTNTALTVILAVFMGGLGMGGLYFGKIADNSFQPTRVFAIINLGIAASAILLMALFSFLPGIYAFLFHFTGGHFFISSMLMIFFSVLVLLFPTALMGGTFPLLSKILARENKKIGTTISSLYTVNTAGGILGAGLSGYVFIKYLGQNNSLLMAIGMNLLIGIIVFLSAYTPLPSHTPAKHKKSSPEDIPNSPPLKNWILIAAFVSGFCSLGYEIFWNRAMGVFLPNSSYVFSSILVIFLLGITLGSFLCQRLILKLPNLIMVLAFSQLLVGLLVIVGSSFLAKLPLLLEPFQAILRWPIGRILFPGFFFSFLLILLPAILMGISFPLICTLFTSTVQDLGKKLGFVYFINTLGSVAGPVAAGFLIMPVLGTVKGLLLLAGLQCLLGIILFWKSAVHSFKINLSAIGLVIGAAGWFSFHAFQHTRLLPPSLIPNRVSSEQILYYRETTSGTVTVSENTETKIRSCYVNNSSACGITYDALKIVKMLGHLPFLINPNAENALIIGFGIGVTTSVVASHPITKIDCIEICPGVKAGADYFQEYNQDVLNNPKVNFISGDGRHALLLSREKYDLISCDPIHPTLGSGNLYTRDFFQFCKNHLQPQGILTQYLPLHKLTVTEFKMLIKTFHAVFPNTTIWLGYSHGMLLGSAQPLQFDFQQIKEFTASINDIHLTDPYLLATSLLINQESIPTLTGNVPLNTDNHPRLEFFSPLGKDPANWHLNLMELLTHRSNPLKLIKNPDDPEKFKRYIYGQNYFLNGLIQRNQGNRQKMLELFKQAISINPENAEIRLILDHELNQTNKTL
jgi:spermidine synthase